MVATSTKHFTPLHLGSQPVHVIADADPIVQDTGLLSLRRLDLDLDIIDALAHRLPDTRSPQHTRFSMADILGQSVYQILAGYPDANDAQQLTDDPLHRLLAGHHPTDDEALASRSTTGRFLHAYTRRRPHDDQDPDAVIAEVEHARCQRLVILNDYLPELFIRTRRTQPAEIIIDLDATDDPVHGQQNLSGYHGYYRQHQYLPLLAFEGNTGFPLAAWLRPGTAHASWGAIDVLEQLVRVLRQAWPCVPILVRADNGFAVPEFYRFCEDQNLDYVLGYGSNAVLERAVAQAVEDVDRYWRLYGWRSVAEPVVQRFEEITGYQADSWDKPRRIVAKIEQHGKGAQQRFVVTNRKESAEVIYRELYIQRGKVPEQPIDELKNGLRGERLSCHRFRANALKMLVHVLAYALVVLWREACAEIPEVATARVQTLRQKWWKVPALVEVRQREVRVRVWSGWSGFAVWQEVQLAVVVFVAEVSSHAGWVQPTEVVI